MDQRVKGGNPPTAHTPLAPTAPPEDSDQERVAEIRRSGEGENGDLGKREEERRGAGRKREGDKGAVLELLIEGRCGSTGQQELEFPGREASCPEGNVRLRIGLQAKRTKKPPKILESYVCKPTIRTYQRQGRVAALRGDGEGGVGQQGKTSPTLEEATREQSSGLESVQPPSKQTSSTASPLLSSSSLSASSLQPLALSTFPTASSPASAPVLASQGTKSAKQVPIKLADKTEVNSNGSSERVKKDKLPSVNGQAAPAGHKPCSPKTDQTAPTTPSTPSLQNLSAVEPRGEGDTANKHNGVVQTGKQKGQPNGKSSSDILGPTKSSKVKAGKHNSSSSATPRDSDSATRSPISGSFHKEHNLSHKSRTESPCSPSITPKPQSSPTMALSSGHSPKQDPSLQPSLGKKREKEKKAKKEKRKEKKSKRERGEAERAKNESRKEEGKKKKKEKGKEGKSKHGKGKDERSRIEDTWRNETEKGKAEKKRDKLSPDRHRAKDNNAKPGETDDSGKLEKTCKLANPGRPDEKDKADDASKLVKHAEPVTAGDPSKPKEQDVPLRHPTVPTSHPSSAPSSLPTLSARPPMSPPSSPPEQDSRPLKKRKARRPSWTKLVHRAQRVENQEAPLDSHHNPLLSFPQNSKTSPPTKATVKQTEESHPAPTSSSTTSSSALSAATKPPTPDQSHPNSDPSPPASRSPITPARKRGRPKSHTSSLDEPPPRLSPTATLADVAPAGCEGVQKAPALEPSPMLPFPAQSNSTPRKRGRPPKRPLSDDQSGDVLSQADLKKKSKDVNPEKGNRELKIRRLISEMKKRKKRRLQKGLLSDYAGKAGSRAEADGETSPAVFKTAEAVAKHTLSALSSSFGGKLGPQINVSKRGTIYMGKRRGRKPKSQTANLNSNSQNSVQPSLFTNPSETSLFSNQPQPPSHPFPSPSLTHSSGAQSPYSEGSLTEPTSSLLFPHPFSLPSPSSSCTSPRPPSSSSLSPFVKKSCPCQGRHHFPFHQSSCKLSSPTPPLHHTPGSPAHLKEATPSPRSESHSEETLPSDSGIGTDNNSVSERGEMRGGRGILRMGQGSGVMLGGQRHPSSLVDRPSPVSSPLSPMHRQANPITNPANVERHRERHRHRRREYDCVSSCTCLCPCPCPGHNKCTHSDYYTCLGHNALKRQKNKHKKKHQQLHMQDPEFLSELDDLIGQFSEVHIGRRSWARTGLGQGFSGSGNAAGGRRHHSSSSHPLRSNIFRINLNGFYSPHPSSYSTNPSFSAQPFYPCQPVHCGRKPERRQCGCPSKFQETIDDMGFYRGYPPTTPLYSHLHSSYPIPSPHQYAPHQPHHPHFLLNPARFHRRRTRLLREGGLGGEVEGELGGGSGGGPHLSSGFATGLSCGCGRSEHKHKHKHRHLHCERDVDDDEEVHEDEEEDDMEREGLASLKPRSGFIMGPGEGGRKGTRGMGSLGSAESPWLCENGKDPFSSPAAVSASSSSTSSTEKYKHTSLTSLGLGSSHLSSFGGGWGGLGQPWMKVGGLGGTGFGLSNPSWRTFTGGPHTGRMGASDREEDDEDEIEQTHLYRSSPSPTHTNLFTSAAMASRGRGLRSGMSSRNPIFGDRPWRREEPAWTERRGPGTAGLQGDSRSRGQQKSVPAPDGVTVKKKRRPGRPRKHPLPSPVSSPTHSSAAPPVSSTNPLPGHCHNRDGRGVGGRKEERGVERERGGGDVVQQVTESVLQAKKKRGRKRKRSGSPCHQSTLSCAVEDKPECDAPPECFGQSELDQAPSQTVTVQWEERADGPPRKKFLRAGLYSDDYKTTDPPSQAQQASRESMEYTPGENDYTLLPAPIHVGKYLRLKRIDFQLPYDVLWLWRNNQLHRQPAVPLKRKRHYCRMKEKTVPSQQTVEESSSDIASLFPHLDMEPLTSTERGFVVKHHVFLLRNWELVRDRQIQLRIEREREREAKGEERDNRHLSCDGASGDDSHIKSGP
ncbi:histone-lysine N-methyltransferase ASH1L-like isoform X2 [Myripristis murdjan]|uniref:histone-lysine N-methyltransferase ASH1L-like isoform X2 n=1 Tax=Myripristis murdjan TaxID=586833 RepID=UPI0011763F32|nr:histone-lysine N-methyltransferase ASH1L-like isoform X2 [Myripristis murdjan]